jgi:hypothetical protein
MNLGVIGSLQAGYLSVMARLEVVRPGSIADRDVNSQSRIGSRAHPAFSLATILVTFSAGVKRPESEADNSAQSIHCCIQWRCLVLVNLHGCYLPGIRRSSVCDSQVLG